jgi:hypothetical protein
MQTDFFSVEVLFVFACQYADNLALKVFFMVRLFFNAF